jgi:site-specific DNA-methyltransferase (adenine-specific)
MDLRHGDCLEVMKELENDSVDLLFADLPYCQTSCKWDVLIDLELFWEQVNRVCKKDTPMIFTCSVKFGNTLINSNPKNFRYDLIWAKSSACGFLNSKKMPMKKHEMIYIFYRKLPKVYTENIALHHTHKNTCKYDMNKNTCKYDVNKNTYGGGKDGRIKISKDKRDHAVKYDPPLPNSVIKEEKLKNYDTLYGNVDIPKHPTGEGSRWSPPLPNSILEMKSEKGKHATQKPVSLMEWILKYYSREGDVVLDATMGSGSMGVACINKNRSFIGIEKDETIYNVALDRCKS